MKKPPSQLEKDIENQIIECVSQIYWHYNQNFNYSDVLKSVKYNGRTKSRLLKLVKAVKKMSANDTNIKIIDLRNRLNLLVSLYAL